MLYTYYNARRHHIECVVHQNLLRCLVLQEENGGSESPRSRTKASHLPITTSMIHWLSGQSPSV